MPICKIASLVVDRGAPKARGFGDDVSIEALIPRNQVRARVRRAE